MTDETDEIEMEGEDFDADPGFTPEPPEIVKEKVESGEYFRDARNAYSSVYLTPMSERYFYLITAIISLIVFGIATFAVDSILPLRTSVPFGYISNNVIDQLPRIRALATENGQDANKLMRSYLIEEYVRRREGYNIDTLEVDFRYVRAQSTQEVFSAYEKTLDLTRPDSPIALYQRHSVRKIEIFNRRMNDDGSMDVFYEATVEGQAERKKTLHVATVAFQYGNVTVDQKTAEASPLKFAVTDYRNRRVQE